MKYKAIDGLNWLKRPWQRLSYNDYYRHYVKRTDKAEEYLLVFRSSDKCYRVVRWRVPYARHPKPVLYAMSFKYWSEVEYYASREIH